jgi:hypothetical protein
MRRAFHCLFLLWPAALVLPALLSSAAPRASAKEEKLARSVTIYRNWM